MPVSPTPAFKIGEKASNPIEMYLADIFTVTANLIDSPAISIPSGFTIGRKTFTTCNSIDCSLYAR